MSAATSPWLGTATLAEVQAFVRENNYRLRAGSQGVLNKKTLQYRRVPVIECWDRKTRRYKIFSADGLAWYFDSEHSRDEMLAALKEGGAA